jgi:hypothetical protein
MIPGAAAGEYEVQMERVVLITVRWWCVLYERCIWHGRFAVRNNCVEKPGLACRTGGIILEHKHRLPAQYACDSDLDLFHVGPERYFSNAWDDASCIVRFIRRLLAP